MPAISGVWEIDTTTLGVKFDGAVGTAANTAANWTVSDLTVPGSVTVSVAARQADTSVVYLTTGTLTRGRDYRVTANSTVTTTTSSSGDARASVLSTDALHYYGFTNVSQAVAYANGYAFYVWFDASFNVKVSRVTLADGTKSTSPTLYTASDPHEDPHVLIDPTDNCVVVVSGGYLLGSNSYGKIWKSTAAYGTTFGTGVALPACVGTTVTTTSGPNTIDNSYNYPVFGSDGTLMIVTQWQGDSLSSGDEVWVYKYAGDGTGKTAAQLASGSYIRKLFEDRGGSASPATYNRTYISPLVAQDISSTIRVGMTFTMYRPNPGATSYSYGSGAADWGVGYLYTDNFGTTWKKADGTTVTGAIDAETTVADTTFWAYTGSAARGARVALKTNGTPILVGRPSTLTLGGSTYTITGDSHTVFDWTGSAWTSHDLDTRATGPAADFGYPPAITYDATTDTTYVTSNRADSGTYATDQLTLDYRVGSTWGSLVLDATEQEASFAHATPWSYIDDGDVFTVLWNRFGRTFTGQSADTFATVMWDQPMSQAPLTITSSSTWTQAGTTIAVIATDLTSATATARVYSVSGGRVIFIGTSSSRFEISADNSTWAGSLVVSAGASTVYLRCTRQSGDRTLTAQIGVPGV